MVHAVPQCTPSLSSLASSTPQEFYVGGPFSHQGNWSLKSFRYHFSPLSVSSCCAAQSLFVDHRVHFIRGCSKFVCRPISVGMSSLVVTYTTWEMMGGVQLIVEPRAILKCSSLCAFVNSWLAIFICWLPGEIVKEKQIGPWMRCYMGGCICSNSDERSELWRTCSKEYFEVVSWEVELKEHILN